jgi:hypothetical protein
MSRDPSDIEAARMAATVIVFARAPVPGHAKTRLIPALGAQGAAALARRMLEHAVSGACQAALGPVEVCVTPDASHPVFAALRARLRFDLAAQGEGDIGVRMDRALARALTRSHAALLIGTDLPAIDADILRAAARALNDHDAVFVPVLDGGYGLVGLRRPTPALFRAIPWSTSDVMATTRTRARALGLRIAELPPIADIDEAADLDHVPASWLPTADTHLP